MMPVLLSGETTTTDPLALIVGACGAAISALAMLVWGLLLARVQRIERRLDGVDENIMGREGIYSRLTRIEGKLEGIGGLSQKEFESAMRQQNEWLRELRERAQELDGKVQKIDRTLVAGQRSYTPEGRPVARPLPREEPPSDPPIRPPYKSRT